MHAAPGPVALACEAPLRAPADPHRSPRRTALASWQGKTSVVVLVMVLGLLQGTRTALGGVPPASPARAADVASPPAREHDPIRGHFFRPPGSNAMRPPLSLRPVAWWPERPIPVALR